MIDSVKTNKLANWAPIGLVAAMATLASAPFLIFGPPYGADMRIHLSWSQQFALQLWSGELYPRWLSELNGGAGSPTFFYYAPFPFYVSGFFGPLLCPACRPETHLAIGLWLLLLASGMAFYAFARRAGPWAAAIGAIVYMLLPYHYEMDLWRRFAYGELSAYVWMPLILLAFDKTLDEWRYLPACALAYAGLLLSHLPATLLFSLMLAVYVLLQMIWRKSWRPLWLLGGAVALGGALAAVYLVPALAAEDYVDAAQMYVRPSVPPHRLWTYDYFHYRNWLFLDGRNEPSTRIASRVRNGLIGGTAMLLLLSAVIYRAKGRQAWRELAPWLLGIALVWFIVTPLSIPLFESVRLLQEVDFPFRIVIVADLAVATVFVLAVRTAWQHRDRLSQLLIGLAATILLAFLALSGKPFAYNLQPFFTLLKPFQTRQVIDENAAMVAAGWDSLEFFMPVWTKIPLEDFRSAVTRIPRVTIDTPDGGTVQIVRWTPRDIGLHADLSRGTQITVRQFYFPTWRARNAATGGAFTVTPSNRLGLVTIEAPAGRYDIALRLEPLWQEQLGAVLSGLGLAVAGGLFILSRRKLAPSPSSSHS